MSLAQKRSLVVVKVGGSLLDWSGLREAIGSFLDEMGREYSHVLIVTGGGELAEAIRHADQTHQLGEAASHQLAIEAMQLSASLLASILAPRAALVRTREELLSWQTSERATGASIKILQPLEFLTNVEPHLPGNKLFASWDVTSDTIAARVAEVLQADELVLLKSIDGPSGSALELAQAGIVDSCFPQYAAGIRWRIVNLRSKQN